MALNFTSLLLRPLGNIGLLPWAPANLPKWSGGDAAVWLANAHLQHSSPYTSHLHDSSLVHVCINVDVSSESELEYGL